MGNITNTEKEVTERATQTQALGNLGLIMSIIGNMNADNKSPTYYSEIGSHYKTETYKGNVAVEISPDTDILPLHRKKPVLDFSVVVVKSQTARTETAMILKPDDVIITLKDIGEALETVSFVVQGMSKVEPIVGTISEAMEVIGREVASRSRILADKKLKEAGMPITSIFSERMLQGRPARAKL